MTYPAPLFLDDDPWFGSAPITESKIEYEKFVEEQELVAQVNASKEDIDSDSIHVKESENIHQIMYEIATKNNNTTLHLNPTPSFGGGSENFHEGSGGWMSGVGLQ